MDEIDKLNSNFRNKQHITFLYIDKTRKIVMMNKTLYIKKVEDDIIQNMDVEEIDKDPNNKFKLLLRYEKQPDRKTTPRKNFTPNIPTINAKLKDYKDPIKIRPKVNKKLNPIYKLDLHLKVYYKKLLTSYNTAIITTNQFIS